MATGEIAPLMTLVQRFDDPITHDGADALWYFRLEKYQRVSGGRYQKWDTPTFTCYDLTADSQ